MQNMHQCQAFNQDCCGCLQAEQMLGMTADELAGLKESNGTEAYEAVLKAAQWKDWQLRVQSKSQ